MNRFKRILLPFNGTELMVIENALNLAYNRKDLKVDDKYDKQYKETAEKLLIEIRPKFGK